MSLKIYVLAVSQNLRLSESLTLSLMFLKKLSCKHIQHLCKVDMFKLDLLKVTSKPQDNDAKLNIRS